MPHLLNIGRGTTTKGHIVVSMSNSIPSEMRHAHIPCLQLGDRSRKDIQQCRVRVVVAAFEQNMHTSTDTKKRSVLKQILS